jgi:hypothetical protein
MRDWGLSTPEPTSTLNIWQPSSHISSGSFTVETAHCGTSVLCLVYYVFRTAHSYITGSAKTRLTGCHGAGELIVDSAMKGSMLLASDCQGGDADHLRFQ